MIVIDRPDLRIHVELGPAPPKQAQYIELSFMPSCQPLRLTAAEAKTLAAALILNAAVGRLVE